MKNLIKTEEIAKVIGAYLLTLHLDFHWWAFWIWLIAPDISILAYLINTRVGALVYNLFHHQGLAILLALAGLYGHQESLQFAGLLLFGHSAMDRVFGYGLKYPDDFRNTHLGWIGKPK